MFKRLIGTRYTTALLKQLICIGIYPYNHVNNFVNVALLFFHEQQLPLHEFFNSTLTKTQFSNTNYGYALSIWRKFGRGTHNKYIELNLKTNVFILANVFEIFRAT